MTKQDVKKPRFVAGLVGYLGPIWDLRGMSPIIPHLKGQNLTHPRGLGWMICDWSQLEVLQTRDPEADILYGYGSKLGTPIIGWLILN